MVVSNLGVGSVCVSLPIDRMPRVPMIILTSSADFLCFIVEYGSVYLGSATVMRPEPLTAYEIPCHCKFQGICIDFLFPM